MLMSDVTPEGWHRIDSLLGHCWRKMRPAFAWPSIANTC